MRFLLNLLLLFSFLQAPIATAGLFGSTPEVVTQASTTTALANGASFTSVWIRRAEPQLVIAITADQNCTFKVQFSPDASNVDSTLTYQFEVGVVEPPKTLIITRDFFRVVVENDSGVDMTYLRLQTSVGSFGLLTSPLNSVIAQDADATISRQIPPEFEIAAGKFYGWDVVNKIGKNSDVDSGTLPEAVIEAGGTYTGFPKTSPEEFQVFSSSASDTGTLTFSYLASSTSTAYQSHSVQLQGQTQVNTGVTGYRAHTMRYNSGSDTTFNVGTITLRWRTTTSVVFLTIIPGRSQSNYMVYTVPYGFTAYLKKLTGAIRGGNNTTVDGSLWVRASSGSPRYRRPFTIGVNSPLDTDRANERFGSSNPKYDRKQHRYYFWGGYRSN